MNGGIDQLVDTYKGNPQPLAANLQQAQKQQPPGSIPADLEEAIALQKIAELRNAFAGQQAMQAGGAQQTVMDKLKQIVGGMQAQTQPAAVPQQMMQRPVMAASGGSIDRLVSNLGTNYANGGIVAFDGTKGSKVEDKDAEKAKQREEDRRALLGFPAALADIVQLPVAAGYNLAADAGTGLERFLNRVGSALTGENINTQTDDQVGNKFRFSPTPFTDMLRSPTSGEMQQKQKQQATADANPETQKLLALAASRAETGQNTNPALQPNQAVAPAAPSSTRTNVGIGNGPAQPATEKVDPTSLRGITEAYLRGELGIKPEDERQKAVDWTKKTLGLDALLAEKQGRIDSRAAAIEAAKAARTPEWVKGLQALSGAPIRGGAGMVLGQMGAGATRAREAYAEQDMKYADELDRLRDVITDAKISGNKELVKEGMAAYKEVDARRRAAATSATSLVATDATNAARLQASKDAAAGRAQSAAAMLEERKARRIQDQNQFLAKLQLQNEALLNKDPEWQRMSKMKGMLDLQMMATTDEAKREKIADQLSEQQAKMAAYATSKIGSGMAGATNIPPPPKDAVKRIG